MHTVYVMISLILSTDQLIDNIDLITLSLTVLIVQLVSILIYIDRTIRNVFVDQRKSGGNLRSHKWLTANSMSLQVHASEQL